EFQVQVVQVDAEALEEVDGDRLLLLEQSHEDVLGAEVVVAVPVGLLVGQLHHAEGRVGEGVEHGAPASGVGMVNGSLLKCLMVPSNSATSSGVMSAHPPAARRIASSGSRIKCNVTRYPSGKKLTSSRVMGLPWITPLKAVGMSIINLRGSASVA